ncbi:unnamed protein product [Oppiella nova]|uniref:Peptidase S54 rhomboid domain-containing protein n=1 Tax=Oppiella nova TaxID=334625 RepID=A0A7R9QI31_9ACAR|nr:unnamed protein product [Oppiella nova]CAG2165452.1 unnamed protein product [Oppiella nova]
MQDYNDDNSDQNEHQLRRAVSLDPRMTTPQETVTTSSASIHANPMFDGNDDHTIDGRNSSLRRQVSEPARNQHRINPTVTRAESIKQMAVRGAQQLFGITEDSDSHDDDIWLQRRRRLLRNYGKLKQKEEPVIPLRARTTTESPGFDETDGVLRTKIMTAFSETQRDLSPEDVARKPALKITMKAIAMASNAIKKRLSNRTDQLVLRPDETGDARLERGDGSQTLTADSVFLQNDAFDGSFEDFFVKPAEPRVESHEEVDASHRRPPMAAPNMWSIQRQVSVKEKSIPEQIYQQLLRTDNSNRREFGLGLIDRLLGRRRKKDLSKEERTSLSNLENHIDDFRPFFTYWITTVQILILIISLSAYGFGHWGLDKTQISGLVYVKSLSLQQVDYFELQNFWFGPRSADLIHLGAKYTPCMRRDEKVYKLIEGERSYEKTTGCCIRNDGSGCVQTHTNKCSPLLSSFTKWERGGSDSMGRNSGPVCGQDPRFCEQPASIEPYEWADDITKWPICRKTSTKAAIFEPHMRCELIARPCCLGINGECHITTREFCDFIKGFFHEEATLCSQVSCMGDVCGMIPFYSDDSPDQIYRIFTPIFLHAGLGHILITALFQFFIMKEIEKMTGWARMAAIYLVSGITGYLASAVFLPFRPEVGPAGSLYGVMAYFFVELKYMWKFMENPYLVLMKQIAVATVLLMLGFLPWIDNYAHGNYGIYNRTLIVIRIDPEYYHR